MSWHKDIHFPGAPRNEDQEGIEEVRRAIRERRRDQLPVGPSTSEDEIIEMATVVEQFDFDPERFLRILHQDSERYGIEPEEVYVVDRWSEEPRWPEAGFDLTASELEWLHDACCTVAEQVDPSLDDSYHHQPAERLEEFCSFLTVAMDIDVPPVVARGDQ